MPVTSLRKTSVRPPEVAICVACTIAHLEAKPEQEQEQATLLNNGYMTTATTLPEQF
jgi:hypothetical protein